MPKKFDFSGYATKFNVPCTDGRTIKPEAFTHCNNTKVPLLWQHSYDEPSACLGHALLECREDGVYAYGSFNETTNGAEAKELVQHGDISALSIRATDLRQAGKDVVHGIIREVSLVLSGANPEAFIDDVALAHGFDGYEAIIHTGVTDFKMEEAEEDDDAEELDEELYDDDDEDDLDHNDTNSGGSFESVYKSFNEDQIAMLHSMLSLLKPNATPLSEEDAAAVQKVFNGLTEAQKIVTYAILTEADTATHSQTGENMPRNVFANTDQGDTTLTHAETLEIFADVATTGSLKNAMLAHSITDIDKLFPDAQNITGTPYVYTRDMAWVSTVLGGCKKSPFSRIKTVYADLTDDEARARGYIKGKEKLEQVFDVLTRETTPQTIYKKQALDRDDIIDITDFDVVRFMQSELRVMLEEELGRAILVGDGRLTSDDSKIKADKIRPIYSDDSVYTLRRTVPNTAVTNEEITESIIEQILRVRKEYRGSGMPTMFVGPDVLATMTLAKDNEGRYMYDSVEQIAKRCRVANIVEVPILDTTATSNKPCLAIIVNLTDYTIGSSKGGQITTFNDFDLDYNKEKYLIETRLCGALTHPKTAIVIEQAAPTTPPTG